MNKKHNVILVLDNIRSVHNAGSIFRTAEGAGVSRIICAGTTPCPIDRFGRKRPDFAKVSLGAENLVSWSYKKEAVKAVKSLKVEGYQVIALEQVVGSIDYRKIKAAGKAVLIVGNEVEGVNESLVNLADIIAEIPMSGAKESLNVSVAAGIALYGMLG